MKFRKSEIENNIRNGYDVDVPDYWSKIENAKISETTPVVTKSKKHFPLYRIVSAAACLAVIVTGLSFLPKNNDNLADSQSGTVDSESGIAYGQNTPVRIGQLGSVKASFAKPYTFKEAFEEADMVVEIVITKWLGELDQEGLDHITYFKAVIMNEYKNNINFQAKEIVLLQQGNSKWTYKGYPLFKNGDRLLLSLFFVDPLRDSDYSIEGEDCFTIVGSQLTEMQVMEKDGKNYALKRNYYQNYTDIQKLIKSGSAEIIEDAFIQDEVLSQAGTGFECMYSIEDLKKYMDKLRRDDGNE